MTGETGGPGGSHRSGHRNAARSDLHGRPAVGEDARTRSRGGRMTGGRVVVVTGGNRGLGREVARQCAARGDTVVLGARDLAAGERAARELPGRVRAVRLDVTDAEGLAALAEDVTGI